MRNQAYFFEFLTYLKAAQAHQRHIGTLRAYREFMKRAIELQNLSNMSNALQIGYMKLIFRREDFVWRSRGGRPGEETLVDFLR